jgi:hypothetical protein
MRLADRFVVSLLLAALAPAVAAQERFNWNKWYAGAGLGAGFGERYRQGGRSLSFDDGLQGATDKSGVGAFNVVGGIELDPRTLLGISVSGVAKTGKINGNDARTQINNYFAMLTYFPYERGFFVRGGGGFANMVVDDGSTSSDELRSNGIGIQLGAGYALQVVKSHYVTFSVDQSFQFYSSSDTKPERSRFAAAYLGYMYRH